MFTGIIEELGTIKKMTTNNQSMCLIIGAKQVLTDVKLGDSIAINGVCLTVTKFGKDEFSVDVMPETYKATSLSMLKPQSRVNLEAALRFNGHVGGHFVTGHVDGVGTIKSIVAIDNALNYEVEIDKELTRYCIYKGSIAVDGTSLTIFGIKDNVIRLSLIPHTVKNSVIGSKKVGDLVNIECDMLGKYAVNLVQQNVATGVTKDLLEKNGFIG